MHKKLYHDFFGKWFSHSNEFFRRRTVHFWELFVYRTILWLGGGDHDFLSKLFCLTVPKKLVGDPFFQKISGPIKLHKKLYHDFVENWFSHSTEIFRSGTVQFWGIFFYRKFLWLGGGDHDFLSKLFCLTVQKILVGGRLCFRNFLV